MGSLLCFVCCLFPLSFLWEFVGFFFVLACLFLSICCLYGSLVWCFLCVLFWFCGFLFSLRVLFFSLFGEVVFVSCVFDRFFGSVCLFFSFGLFGECLCFFGLSMFVPFLLWFVFLFVCVWVVFVLSFLDFSLFAFCWICLFVWFLVFVCCLLGFFTVFGMFGVCFFVYCSLFVFVLCFFLVCLFAVAF